jgi:hypothetical protein
MLCMYDNKTHKAKKSYMYNTDGENNQHCTMDGGVKLDLILFYNHLDSNIGVRRNRGVS